jgi:hypothetical protein
MTPKELKQVIFEELNQRDINSWHDITKENIDKVLIEPERIELVDVLGQRRSYLKVLDECPSELEQGYLVIYDVRENMFGLATKTTISDKGLGFMVGLYGSFVDALNAM